MRVLTGLAFGALLAAWPLSAMAQDVNVQGNQCDGDIQVSNEETIQACKALLQLQMDDNSRADIYNNLALAYGRSGNPDKEFSDFSDALRLLRGHREPEYMELANMIRFNRARAFADARRYEDAIADYDLLLAARPGYGDYIDGRAEAQAALDKKNAGGKNAKSP